MPDGAAPQDKGLLAHIHTHARAHVRTYAHTHAHVYIHMHPCSNILQLPGVCTFQISQCINYDATTHLSFVYLIAWDVRTEAELN